MKRLSSSWVASLVSRGALATPLCAQLAWAWPLPARGVKSSTVYIQYGEFSLPWSTMTHLTVCTRVSIQPKVKKTALHKVKKPTHPNSRKASLLMKEAHRKERLDKYVCSCLILDSVCLLKIEIGIMTGNF